LSTPPRELAIYAGSFDPVTNGHLDLVDRVSKLFSQVVVAVGVNPTRTPLFDKDERLTLLTEVCRPYANVRVASFDGLLIDFARSVDARVIVRGLRAGSDFEYELQIAHCNGDLAPELDTVFLPTRTNYGFISASLVREIARHNGEIERYAPKNVCVALRRKFGHERG
jgi:pantetheine-phosphate adenylyltransferase